MDTGGKAGQTVNPGYVSTGHLPAPEQVRALVDEAHERYKSVAEGKNSEVYPALARVPSDLFGICVVGTSGNVYAVGDAEHEFTIMSVSKPFVFALVCEALGAEEARRRLGVNATGLPFNSLGAIEQSARRPDQPDGELGGDRDDQPRAGRDARGQVAVHPRRPVPVRRPHPAARTRKSTPRRRPPTSATRASPACCRATSGSTWTRPRRPTSTPSSAR